MKTRDKQKLHNYIQQLIFLNDNLYKFCNMIDDTYVFIDNYFIIETIQNIRFLSDTIIKIYSKYEK